jgi:hypothetical protein
MDEKKIETVKRLNALIEAAQEAGRATEKIFESNFEYLQIRVCPPDGHGVITQYTCRSPIAHEFAEIAHGELLERCEELHNELIETA